MRAVGYILLLFLTFYFLLLKPYLLARRVEWDLKGLSVSLKEGIGFDSFFLHAPIGHITLHLFLKRVSLQPWRFQVEEFNLIEVSKAPPSDKPFHYDFTNLTRLAERLNLRVDKLYISLNYIPHSESLTLFIPKTELRAGRVRSEGWTEAYWMRGQNLHHLEVLPKDVRAVGGELLVEGAEIKSKSYHFQLKASWKGKEGSFEAWGRVLPLEGRHFRLGDMPLSLRGSLNYRKLRASFEGSADIELKERKSYRALRVEGEYLWEWRGKNRIKASLIDSSALLELDYSLKEGLLRGRFSRFLVDEKLLSLKRKVLGMVNGELSLDVREGFLKLRAHAPFMEFDQHSLGGVELRLWLHYRDIPRGSFEFSSLQPFQLDYRGSFLGSNLVGDATLLGYSVKRGDTAFQLYYKGLLALREGRLYLKGAGKLGGITYRDLSLGSADYTLNLEGDAYTLRMVGEGFSLEGQGSIREESFSGGLRLEGINFSYRGVEVNSLYGSAGLSIKKDKVSTVGSLYCSFSGRGFSSRVGVGFELLRGERGWSGSFEGNLGETGFMGFSYKEGRFEGRLDEEALHASFNFGEHLKGEGGYRFKEGSYQLQGSLRESLGDFSLTSSYSLRGMGEGFRLSLAGTGGYKGFSFPIRAYLEAKGDRMEGALEGFTLKDGLWSLRVEGARLYGSRGEGSIEVKPVSLMLGQEVLGRLDFEKGSYKDGSLGLKGRLSGVAEGPVVVHYLKGLNFSSEGYLDLGKLSALLRSRLLADAEGKVSYRLSYGGEDFLLLARSEKVILRSRYLAMPLQGNLELNLKEEGFQGRFQLQGNQRASLLAQLTGKENSAKISFEMSQLPVLYRGEDIRTSLFLSGKGSVSYNHGSLNIGGTFYTSGLVNLQRWSRKKSLPPEEYKRVSLDLSFNSSEPLRINLPEGFLYADLSASIKGTLYEPDYRVNAYLKGGKLSYFERDFFVRKGEVNLTRKESELELSLTTPTPDYTIILDLKGHPQYPKVIVRSEPPRDSREVLTALVLGSEEGEGLIPIGGALISQVPQLSGFIKGAKGVTGLDVKVQVYPSMSTTGEVGISASISKEITDRLSVEHRQSTLKDPKETYTAGEAKLTPNTSIGGKLYSDKTQEVRIRIRKKFDF
ncbi:MAG: translocation/assembly module TamB domain-containing protein [Aquificaceae bacterium]|nr:translocation/assembly module TamB domain-containing protein [Aquificaceae bacterium]